MSRKEVTSRFRGTDIFSRRIVITVSRSGLLAVIVSTTIIGLRFPYGIINIISVVCTIIALMTTIEARHQLRNLRYEIREKEVAQLEHWTVPEGLPDLRASVEAAFEDIDDATAVELRLSERPHTS